MNLVNELQSSAEKDDVLTVLRKARRLASKLGVNDIDDWLKYEQNGYNSAKALPAYRKVKGSLVFKTNGYIPMGWGQIANGIMDYPGSHQLDCPIGDAISELLAHIEGNTKHQGKIYYQVKDDGIFDAYRNSLNEFVADQVTFMLRLNEGQIRAIPEAVKDKILDWACELERKGVHGENMTFNDTEKQAAHTITFNINNSTIEQLTNSGINRKGA